MKTILSFQDFLNEKKTPKYQKRGMCVFPHESPKVKDKKDHFPINSASQARNALARAGQYSSVPPWYDGSLEELKSAIRKKVKSEYSSIEVNESKTEEEVPENVLRALRNIRDLEGEYKGRN